MLLIVLLECTTHTTLHLLTCTFSPSVGSKPKSSSKEVEKDPEGFAFFVSDLNMTIKKEVLSAYFSTFGTVKEALIFPTKGSRMQRKHAFVFMESEESVKKVFDSQPHIICGSEVCVKPDKRKKKANKQVPLPDSPVSSKAIDGTKPASQRCPKWPHCSDLQCAYIHPTAICADTPCPRGTTCPFLHPEDAEKLMSHDSVAKEEDDYLNILFA
ncbi:unnamed protein product [Dibothriocephalus latus]|uniref:RRM domain-containing protein n=1 Tax=Dibothriocephalus latus TaxID=60516 RepID=A0A3P7P4B8_DIBLA|nr:unnamed protein product [Dibothriocephalus latus]